MSVLTMALHWSRIQQHLLQAHGPQIEDTTSEEQHEEFMVASSASQAETSQEITGLHDSKAPLESSRFSLRSTWKAVGGCKEVLLQLNFIDKENSRIHATLCQSTTQWETRLVIAELTHAYHATTLCSTRLT